MNAHRRNIYLAAATAAAAGLAGLGFSSPGYAHDEHKVEKVIVITDHNKAGGKHARKGRHHIRTVHVDGAARLARCDGQRSEIDESTDAGREKTRIVICGRELSPAKHAEHLERALSRIQDNDELSAEHKEKVTAALREAIDRLRAGH
jgi:hypothetical protein